jgi:hypothetical protein
MTTTSAPTPKISASEKRELTEHRTVLESAISEINGASNKVAELSLKKEALKKQTSTLQRRAASNFDAAAETELFGNQTAILRIDEAIQQAESAMYDDKLYLFHVVDAAQEVVQRVGQGAYNALLDQIGEALAPYYPTFNDARFAAKQLPAVSDFVVNFLKHGTNAYDSIERLTSVVSDVLGKVNALLNGEPVWTYAGGKD